VCSQDFVPLIDYDALLKKSGTICRNQNRAVLGACFFAVPAGILLWGLVFFFPRLTSEVNVTWGNGVGDDCGI